MSKWKRVRLDEIADVRDGTHDTPKRSNIGKKLITSKHIVGGRLDKSSAYLISESDYNAVNKRSKVDKYDILISMIGTVGEVYVEENTPNYAIKNLGLIKTDDRELSLWIKYLWNSWYGINEIEKAKSGTTQQFISLTSLRKMKILLPEKEELLKIVDVLSTYDKLIENNNKRIEILEKTAEEIYKEWFVRMRFPGYEKTKFIKGIPEGWEVKRVGDLVNRLQAGHFYKEEELSEEGEVVVIDQSTKEYMGFHNEEPTHIADIENPIILFGDHSCKMIAMIRSFSLGENVVPFKSKNNYPELFLYYSIKGLIQTEEYKRHWKELTNKKILYPEIELQEKFRDTIKNNINLIQKYKIQNQNLIKQRDLLLPRLMNGTIEVK